MATFGPHTLVRDDRGRLRSPRAGADPFRDRALWRDVYGARLLASAGPLARGRAERDRDGVLGHRRQGGRQARLRAPRRPGARAAARLHLPLRGAGRRDGRLHAIPISPPSAPRSTRRSASPRSSSTRPGRTRPSTRASPGLEALDRCETLRRGACARPSATAATCCSARTASSRRRARSGWRGGSSASIRSGSRSRLRPRCPEEMARVARATSIPIATGERLTTKYEFARVLETGAAAILQLNLGRVGGLLEAQEDRRHGRGALRADRAAPLLRAGGRRREHPARGVQPELPHARGDRALGRIPRRAAEEPIRWEDGHVIPPTAPGLGVELDEEVALRHPYDGDELHLEPADGEPVPRRRDARRLRRPRATSAATSPRAWCAPASR